MKLCNETVTVYNARVDPQTGLPLWQGTVIHGVHWHGRAGAAPDGQRGGLAAAARATIRIPAYADTGGRAYAEPAAYGQAEDVSGLWTLRCGDILLHGEAKEAAEPTTPDLRGEWVTVLGVTDERNAPRAPHWKVTGA